MLLCLQKLNYGFKRNRRREVNRVNECASGNGWNRNAAEAVLCGDLQAPAVSTCQQFGFLLVSTPPDRANCVDNVSCFEIAPCSNDRITDWTATNPQTLLIYFRATFCVNGAIRAIAFVQPPVRGGDNSIGFLIGNVAGYEI